jgi:hypothetical protein
MAQTINNNPALLRSKGILYVFDEAASVKKWKPLTLVDSVEFSGPPNPVEVKSPSGMTIFKTLDLDAIIKADWYHPADPAKIELLYRGVIQNTSYDGSTAQTESVAVSFRQNNEAFPLPGFNGAKTAVTINNVKSLDGATTYTGSGTDYSVAVDTVTGISHIVHVSTGVIPLNTDVVVNYTYTPLKSNIVKPNYDSNLVFRHLIIDVFPNYADTTKYRRYYMPNATIESAFMHRNIEIGDGNTSPNLMPVEFKYAKPDSGTNDPKWYYIDTNNV